MTADCAICKRIERWRKSNNPFVIHEFETTLWVVGDHQYYPGYSVLLLKDHVRELHELNGREQHAMFSDLMTATRVVVSAFRPWKMNYQSYGNKDEHVHWHLIPRDLSEPHHLKPPGYPDVDFSEHLIGSADAAAVAGKMRTYLRSEDL